jgi:hypothetical protein
MSRCVILSFVKVRSPYKGAIRTWDKILKQLLKHFTDEIAPAN